MCVSVCASMCLCVRPCVSVLRVCVCSCMSVGAWFRVRAQNYLRVALQEVNSGCTAKTLLVQPYSTTEEVCLTCALKFKVPDPENHALFLLTEGSSQQLAPDTHPQKIKAEIHSRPHAQPFHFVYRRVPNLNLNATAADQQNGNLLSN